MDASVRDLVKFFGLQTLVPLAVMMEPKRKKIGGRGPPSRTRRGGDIGENVATQSRVFPSNKTSYRSDPKERSGLKEPPGLFKVVVRQSASSG